MTNRELITASRLVEVERCSTAQSVKSLALALAFATSLPAAQPHPSLPVIGSLDGLGVNIHFTDPQPGEIEMIKAAGFRWVRMDLTWAATEKARGEYDFSAYDRLVAALEKHGLRALFILDYGHPLYAEPGDKQPFTSRAGTDEFRAAYARWAAAAVARYAGKGFVFELWNEPNHEGFWKPKPDAKHYAALAKAACIAIKQAAPKEALIGPATSTIDLPFIEACFKAGLLEHWCAVSVHPYRQQAPETVEEEYRKLRLLIRHYAPKDKPVPIISSEWGYSTLYPAYAGRSDAEREQMQAKYLARMFVTNIANDVPLSIWYDWRDDGDNPNEIEHRFGIVRRKYRAGEIEVFEPKPAYRALQQLQRWLTDAQGALNPDALVLLQGIHDTACSFIDSSFGRPAFAQEQALTASSDGAADATATAKLEGKFAGSSPEGTITLRYGFSQGWRFIELKPAARELPAGDSTPPKALGLWLHGDGKGCQARLRFTDSTGQTFQADGPKIDFTGWRFVKFPMRSTPEAPLTHWGAANDGVIHYPIKWDSIFLLDNISREPVEGEVYLSAPTLFD